jgi:eukaryotic-like serine/threonine-protein kinase
MALATGARFGPYEIVGALGAGGMGEVYRAHDSRLGRDVAIKILPAAVAADPEWRQRFEREARAISALSHPNICHVYDVGQQDGTDFLVMEYDVSPDGQRFLVNSLPREDSAAPLTILANWAAELHR